MTHQEAEVEAVAKAIFEARNVISIPRLGMESAPFELVWPCTETREELIRQARSAIAKLEECKIEEFKRKNAKALEDTAQWLAQCMKDITGAPAWADLDEEKRDKFRETARASFADAEQRVKDWGDALPMIHILAECVEPDQMVWVDPREFAHPPNIALRKNRAVSKAALDQTAHPENWRPKP